MLKEEIIIKFQEKINQTLVDINKKIVELLNRGFVQGKSDLLNEIFVSGIKIVKFLE